MVYRGEQKWRPPLGIKPTRSDHEFVQALSLMRIPLKEIQVRVGERLGLEKPLSRMSLYYHFKDDLVRRGAGRPARKNAMRQVATKMRDEMDRMIDKARERAKGAANEADDDNA